MSPRSSNGFSSRRLSNASSRRLSVGSDSAKSPGGSTADPAGAVEGTLASLAAATGAARSSHNRDFTGVLAHFSYESPFLSAAAQATGSDRKVGLDMARSLVQVAPKAQSRKTILSVRGGSRSVGLEKIPKTPVMSMALIPRPCCSSPPPQIQLAVGMLWTHARQRCTANPVSVMSIY